MSPSASAEPLYAAYSALLLDLDGTLYRGDHPLQEATEALQALRRLGASGPRLAFVTNNASRTPDQVSAHLGSVGIAAAVAEVLTSAQAAAQLVADRVGAGSAVLVVGGDGLVDAARALGLDPVGTDQAAPVAVVQGWWPGLDWPQLAEGAYALARGVPWIVTNDDLTLPTARGVAPGNGSFVALLAGVTGRRPDAVAGKPGPGLLRQAAAGDRALVVGDRLDTDIAGAVAAGLDSLLVLTGVTSVDAVLVAGPEQRPTYVVPDLSGLLRAAPLTGSHGDRWSCGSALVGLDGGKLTRITGEDRSDLLGAACVASWELSDHGQQVRPDPELAQLLTG